MNKNNFLKIIISVLLMFVFFPFGVLAGESEIKLVVNNNSVNFKENEQKPVVNSGRTYVPLRVISENLGYQVNWDSLNNQVLISSGKDNKFSVFPSNAEKKLRILIDDRILVIPDELGKPYISKKNRTLVPLRAVAEALNCSVSWVEGLVSVKGSNNNTSKVSIASNEEVEKVNIADIINSLDNTTIFGDSIASREQIINFLEKQESLIKKRVKNNFNKEFIPFPIQLVDMYISIGEEYGIRGDIAFCQALKETGYFQFTGDVKPFQNNYCGLWATGTPLDGTPYYNGVDPAKVSFIKGLHGLTYKNPEFGVEAHIQHLYAYASSSALPSDKELFDPRFKYVKRGVASRWTDLNGKWAVPGNGYGESILKDYWLKILQ